jgi:adenylate cyclase
MPLEIERKFLVANDGWKRSISRSIRIRDGLIASNNGHKARVRISDGKATITLKSRRLGPTRIEFEYAIPDSDAKEMLRTMCDGRVLEKVRHLVSYASATWHVDVYDGILDGVVLAEIELERADQKIDLPDWIGKEVTGDPSYRKINLLTQRIAAMGESNHSSEIKSDSSTGTPAAQGAAAAAG